MRVLVATDAWHPQVNGVVRTYERLALEARQARLRSRLPRAVRLPHASLSDLSGDRLSLAGPRAIAAHIAKREARLHPYRHGGADRIHDQALLPQDANGRSPRAITRASRNMSRPGCRCPRSWCYALQRRFHNGAAGTFVATQSIEDELHARGFERLMRWSRGVDTELFRPRKVRLFGDEAGVPLCRPHRRGEEHQGLSRPRSSRPQGSGRQRPAGRRARAASIRRRCSPGRCEGEELAARLCLGRRVRVSEPHRHVRPGAARGAGERRAGGGLSGAAARRTCSPIRSAGVLDWDLKAACAQGADARPPARRGRMRYAIAGRIRRGSSSRTCSSPIICNLPERRRRWRRAAKENGPVGGEPGRLILMRQFGGRLGDIASSQRWLGPS